MKVVNLKTDKYTHYIGRGSIFGNPFKIGIDGNREEVIKKFKIWAKEAMEKNNMFSFTDAIKRLPKNAILGCYCKPKNCHGDIIIEIWEEFNNEIS